MISKILIQGSGSAGKRHLSIAKKMFPQAEIKVFSNGSVKETINSVDYLTEISEVIHFEPQIAVIAGAASTRVKLCSALVGVGTHLLIEKPISDKSEGVLDLINSCQAAKLILAVGYNLQFDDTLIFFRDKVDELIVGKPLLIEIKVGQYLPDWRSNSDYRTSVSAHRKLGGGVLLELSHEINYLEWIFGKIEWVRATIMHQSELDIDVEDVAVLTLGINNSMNRNLVASVNLDFIRHDRERSCIVVGELGSIKWDGLKSEVSIYTKESKKWETIISGKKSIDETYLQEWLDFIDCVESGNSPKVTGHQGLSVLQVIDAVKKSAVSGLQVEVIRNA